MSECVTRESPTTNYYCGREKKGIKHLSTNVANIPLGSPTCDLCWKGGSTDEFLPFDSLMQSCIKLD